MPNDQTTTTTTSLDPNGPEALAAAEAAAAAIPDEDLVPIRVDLTAAASGAIGQMLAIEAHRAEIEATFGERGKRALDDVVPAARGAILADARFNASAEEDLEPKADALREKRKLLVTIVSALAARGLGAGSVLDKLNGGTGYLGLAEDVLTLVHWLDAGAASFGSFATLSSAELRAMQAEAEAFLVAVQRKARAGSSAAAEDRARAFTHLDTTYDLVRKLVTFVRWHEGDYDEIAPSFYAGRTRRQPDDAPVTPAAPPVTPAAPGMPGADPFVRNP